MICELPPDKFLDSLAKTSASPSACIAAIKTYGRHNLEFFVRYFFPHHCPHHFSAMHQDFFDDWQQLLNGHNQRLAIAAPRGHGKSTFWSLFVPIHALVYNLAPYIMILGRTTPDTRQKTKAILNELENNHLLKTVYGDLAPKKNRHLQAGQYGTLAFVAQNGIRIEGKSTGQSLRGYKEGAVRPSLVILDDIESQESVNSEVQRQTLQDWFTKDVKYLGGIGMPFNMVMIGNRLHPESILSSLLEDPLWHGRSYSAILSDSDHPELWEQYRAIATNVYNSRRQENARRFFDKNHSAMLAGTQVLWPDGESYLDLMNERIEKGEASFRSEKLNDPYDPDKLVLSMEKAHWVKVRDMHDGLSIDLGDGTQLPYNTLTERIIFHDPALAKTVKGDYAAIVVLAKDAYGVSYCLDAWVERAKTTAQIHMAIAMAQRWDVERIAFEANVFQGVLADPYRTEIEEQGLGIQVVKVNNIRNKQERIAALEPAIVNGYLRFNQHLPKKMLQQLELFPTTHDDGPDALAGAWHYLNRPKSYVQVSLPGSIPV